MVQSDTENLPPVTITISDDPDNDSKRRRSSWQAKLDRRRRKGTIEPETVGNSDLIENLPDKFDINANRQKRHSWWNIFVPEKNR